MKLKITRPDGTILDIEGTDEECMKVMQAQGPVHVCPAYTHTCPIYVYPSVYPTYPNYPTIPWLSPHITWIQNPNVSTGSGTVITDLPVTNGTVFIGANSAALN